MDDPRLSATFGQAPVEMRRLQRSDNALGTLTDEVGDGLRWASAARRRLERCDTLGGVH